jgi:hypothetical protein
VRTQAGGLARRAGLDALLREASPGVPPVWLDAGSAVAAAGAVEGSPLTAAGEAAEAEALVRSEAILRVMGRLGVAAANVGETELLAGLGRVLELGAAAGVVHTSASLVLPPGASSPLRDHVVVEVPAAGESGPLRIGVVGIVAPPASRPRLGAHEVAVLAPGEALERGLGALDHEGADVRVVLSAGLGRAELRGLVAGRRDVDVVIGGRGLEQSAEREGGRLVALAGGKGKSALEIRLGARTGAGLAVAERFHYLDTRYPADPQVVELQAETNRRINAIHREAAAVAVAAAPRAAELTHATAAGCRPCHVAPYLAWEPTAHARALETLRDRSADFNPQCLRCHVTSEGAPGGFASAVQTPELGGVQCEACHGPARSHAVSGGSVRTTGAAAHACVGCHDEDNSPAFDFAAYWARIRHGGAAGGARAGP